MSIPIAQDETGPVGASPKGPGETQPSSSMPTGPMGTLGGLWEEGTGKANGDGVFFLIYETERRQCVNISKYGQVWGQVPLRSRAAAEAEGQMRLAAFSCTLYSLFFFTRQLMKISSTAPRDL